MQTTTALDANGVPKYGPSDRIVLQGSSDLQDTSFSWYFFLMLLGIAVLPRYRLIFGSPFCALPN